jgi:purine-binding chemotaxis protein CheW
MARAPRSLDPKETLRLCTFEVGGELFAIDIMRIQEIVRPLPVTPVPKSPFGMVGVVDLRGQVLPVFDLRLRFEMEERERDDQTRYLIVTVDSRQLGLVVDVVHDVIEVMRRDLRVGSGVLAGDAARYFVGLCPVGDRLALLLNLHRLLSEADRVAIDAITSIAHPSGHEGETEDD